jgi:hypothetical protein
MTAAGTATAREERTSSPERHNGSMWKVIAVFLAGITLSQASAWTTYVRSAVNRAEVSEQIRIEDPYVQDKAAIALQLNELSKKVEQQSTDISDIRDKVISIAFAVGVNPKEQHVRPRRGGE